MMPSSSSPAARDEHPALFSTSRDACEGFLCSFFAAGLIAAASTAGRKETLRMALKSGTAMAAGVVATKAVSRRDYGKALVAVAGGAAGLRTIDYLFSKSNQSGKENS